ncbi:ABC transporter permease [uncultured Litoreibacter sp.]|uniref:ABC transporter permease n=1 Tax=uncultured Litoreibacter sp. TaxID=1392394 RepID=UPI0026106B28|nr:ABC transporter permease [uncultured Litoreibacter sp.]
MDPLTWTGDIGTVLNPIFMVVVGLFAVMLVVQFVLSFTAPPPSITVNPDGSAMSSGGTIDMVGRVNTYLFLGILGMIAVYMFSGLVTPYGTGGIFGEIGARLLPVWIALIATFALSITFKRKLGLYGKLFDSMIGMIGFAIVMFWVFVALFVAADLIVTHDPLVQVSGMKNKVPGTAMSSAAPEGAYPHYLLGGDNLARDVFSRVMQGSQIVLIIAPAATLFAFMVGITLGLPAGYYGGKFDTVLSFVANLVLAFPVILLFFLLVTPEIRAAGVDIPMKTALVWMVFGLAAVAVGYYFPKLFPDDSASGLRHFRAVTPYVGAAGALLAGLMIMVLIARFSQENPNDIPYLETSYLYRVPTILASILFIFPLVFLVLLWNSRFFTQPSKNYLYIGLTLLIGGYLYLALAWDADPFGMISIDQNVLIVFVAVVFVNSPTVFRIVRGLVLDIKTRDYVAAGQTRGEGAWYIMLWEILPNARGPLIVDFCLRIGYTTILIGTLGFFGLGLESESPDWGTTINAGRRLLGIYPHPAIAPALSLMTLVLGLNLLADGLREESLKD